MALVTSYTSGVYATRAEVEQASLLNIEDTTNNRVPVGMIMWITGDVAPYGWVACNGDTIYGNGATTALYQHLRSLESNRWGEGEMDVKVPDLRNLLNPGQHVTLLACIKL